MQTRALPLGDAGAGSISVLGFGGLSLAPDRRPGADPQRARAALYGALEAGVSFYDVSPSWADGAPERLVGEAIRELRARDWAVLATRVEPLDGSRLSDALPPAMVQRRVEDSLRRTRADALPLVWLCDWCDTWLGDGAWPELAGTLDRLVREGKVLAWGVSAAADRPGEAREAMAEARFAAVQVPLNVFDARAADELFAAAVEGGTAIVARCPFDRGALVAAFDPEVPLPPLDDRAATFTAARRGEAADRAAALRGLLGDEARSLAELALRAVLSDERVATTVAGMATPEHLAEAMSACDGRPLSPALRARLDEHRWERDFTP